MKSSRPNQFGQYDGSPIAKLMSGMLTTIPRLRAKYAGDDKTVEKIHTDEMLAGLEALIATLHDSTFREFDHGRTNIGLLSLALPFRHHTKLGDKFATREWVMSEAVITMLPGLMRSVKGSADVQSELNRLLEENKNQLYVNARKIPCRNELDAILATIKKVIAEQKLFSDASKKAFDRDVAKLNAALYDFGAPYGYFAANVHHPIMYELVIELAKMMMQLPRDLREVVPFINPACASLDLTGGPLGFIVGLFSPRRANLQYKPNAPGQPLSFNFSLTLTPAPVTEDDVPDGDYDGAVYYARYFQYAVSAMLRQIRAYHVECPDEFRDQVNELHDNFMQFANQYFIGKADDTVARSDQARSVFLQKFIDHKVEGLQAEVVNHVVQGVDPDLHGLELIYAIDAAIQRERARKEVHTRLSGTFRVIERELLSYFTKHDQALQDLLQADVAAGFDISYTESPFPDDVFVRNESHELIIIPVKSRYIQEVKNAINQLQYNPAVSAALQVRLQAEMRAYSQQVIQQFQRSSVEFGVGALVPFKQELATLSSAVTADKATANTVAECEAALHKINEQKLALETLGRQAEQVLDGARASIKVANNQLAVDANGEMQRAAGDAVRAVERNVAEYSHDINLVLNVLAEKERHNLGLIANAKAEAEFQESLRNLGPDKLRTMIEDEQREIDRLVVVQEQALKQWKDNDAQLKKTSDNIHSQNQDTQQELSEKIAELKLLNEGVLNQAREVSSQLVTIDASASFEESVKCLNDEIDVLFHQAQELKKRLIANTSMKQYKDNQLFADVKQCLNKKKKPTLSFAKVRQLDMVQSLQGKDGFSTFLSLLGYNEAEISNWLALEAQQNKKFGKPKNEVSLAKLQELHQRIDAAMNTNHAIIKQHAEQAALPALLEKISTLSAFRDGVRNNIAKIQQYEKFKLSAQSLYDDGIRALEGLRDEVELNRQTSITAEMNVNKKRDNVTLYQLNIDLMEGIQPLREKIAAFEALDTKFQTDPALYMALSALNAEVVKLNDMIDAASAKLFITSPMPRLLDAAKKLLQISVQVIERSIEVKLSPELQTIEDFSQEVQSFIAHTQLVAVDQEPYQAAILLQQRHAELMDTMTGLREQVKDAGQIESYLNVLSRAEDRLNGSLKSLHDAMTVKISAALQVCAGVVVANKEKYQWINGQYQRLGEDNPPTSYSDLRSDFERLYQAATLNEDNMFAIRDNIDSVTGFEFNLDAPIYSNDLLAMRCHLRRIQLVMDCKASLDVYLDERNTIFTRKDSRFSQDKLDRTRYISQLNEVLTTYSVSGEIAPVIAKLQAGHGQFYGRKFRPVLNKMMADLLDFERINHVSDQRLSQQPETLAALGARAKVVYDAIPLEGKNRSFKRSIARLRMNVDSLRNKANDLHGEHPEDSRILVALANDLDGDVYRYMLSNPLNEDREQATKSYESFRTIFHARLHSRDDILVKHRSVWPVVFNVIVGVLTVGIALLACLCVTKLAYGRAGLFFQDTSALKRKADEMHDDVVDKLGSYRVS